QSQERRAVRKKVNETRKKRRQQSSETKSILRRHKASKPELFFSKASMCSISSTCTEAGSFDNANVTGEIEFAIMYNTSSCTLEIFIKACKNLAYGEEKKKKCNPYVKVYLLPNKSGHGKMKTSLKKNTVDPLFNETLKYTIGHSQLETRTLQVSVWHSSTLKRKVFLGEVQIPLEMWDFDDNATQSYNWYQLRSKVRDRILFSDKVFTPFLEE
uniref:C2 domain-containing protein n=1 Tax=Leptobrachium leishanense TaxID=445787 RepID=A0A8C5PM56_9ANUR